MHGYSERAKEVLVGKIHGPHPGRLEQDTGKDMQANRLVVELACNPFPAAKVIQGGFRPIHAGADLAPRIALPFIRGAHGEQVFHRNVINSLLSTFYLIIREVGKDLVIHAPNHSLFDGDSHKQRHDALRGGHDVRTVSPLIPVPLVGIDFLSVLQDANLTYIWLIPSDIGFKIPLHVARVKDVLNEI